MCRRFVPILAIVAGLCLSGCVGTEQGEAPAPTASDTGASAGKSPAAPSATGEDLSGAPAGQPRATAGPAGEDLSSAAAPTSGGAAAPVLEDVSGVGGGTAGGLAYDLGRRLGEQTTRSAWQTLSPEGGCDPVDKLAEVIGRSSGRVLSSAERFESREMVDYAEGYVHGMRQAMKDVASRCSERCSVLCDAVHSASTVIYCDVAKRTGSAPALTRGRQAPPLGCASVPRCDEALAAVNVGDCP